MTDPFRLRVMKNLTALIETVAPEDSNSASTGYVHNLSAAVFRGRSIFGDGDPVPMVSILEAPLAEDQLPQPSESAVSNGDWDLLIQGFAKDDKKNPTDPAYLLAADVVRVIASHKKDVADKRRTSGQAGVLLGEKGVLSIQLGSPVCRPADDISNKAYFWLTLRIRVAENLEDPYG